MLRNLVLHSTFVLDGKPQTNANVNIMLREVLDELEKDSTVKFPIGLDAEWNITNDPNHLDTIQLAYVISNQERLFVFQLKSQDLPNTLKAIVNSDRVLWIGHRVSGDLARINRHFNSNIKAVVENCINISKMAAVQNVMRGSQMTLEKICIQVLGYQLPKDLRLAQDWSATLSKEAIEYAARDAWCGLLVFYKFAKNVVTLTGHVHEELTEEEELELSETLSEILPEIRVHLDALHAMKRITGPIPKNHPARVLFQRELRDTIFSLLKNDVELVKEKLRAARADFTFEDKLLYDSEWVFKRVRRVIGPADLLKKSLIALREKFTQDEFTATLGRNRVPVLVPDALKALNEIIENHCACLSDPTDCSLYYQEGKDSFGIPLYHCVRGTNSVESYHQWLEKMFTPWCAGPKLCDAIFTLLRHEWNVSASEKHRPHFPKVGHSFHWILDSIQQSTKRIFGSPIFSWWRHSVDDKMVTSETFGFVATSPDPNFKEEHLKGMKPPSLAYVCSKMKDMAPVLPVLTREEKRLFKENVSNYYTDRLKKCFDFEKFSHDWNNGELKFKGSTMRCVPGIAIKVFKKTPELLERYFRNYQKVANMVACQQALKKSVGDYRKVLEGIRTSRFFIDLKAGEAVPLDKDVTLIDGVEDNDVCLVEDMDVEMIEPSARLTQNTQMIASSSKDTAEPLGVYQAAPILSATKRQFSFDYQVKENNRKKRPAVDKRKQTGEMRTKRCCKRCGRDVNSCPGANKVTKCNYQQLQANKCKRPILFMSSPLAINDMSSMLNIVNRPPPHVSPALEYPGYEALGTKLHKTYGGYQEIEWAPTIQSDIVYLQGMMAIAPEDEKVLIELWIERLSAAQAAGRQ